jgi:hypothetical protein
VEHASAQPDRIEELNLQEHFGTLRTGGGVVGVVGLVVAVLIGFLKNDQFHTFFYDYLIGFMFFLAISLGGLFFVMLQHATKAAWSVNVRRIAEWIAGGFPLMALFFLPILFSVLSGQAKLYPWAVAGWGIDKGFKGWWLGRGFFVGRAVFYFLVWSILGRWYWQQSIRQDETGDVNLTLRMQYRAPVGLILLGFTLTFAAWDWIMSLAPEWYSTIFGVYYFAGCALCIFSSLILITRILQSRGLLVSSVTTEHFHDLGKFLFGFTFFWGYIAFSQFMLQWYGNIPDETGWFITHGASTMYPNQYSPIVIILLFCHLLLPFPGLLSRHVKRNAPALTFWAVWMLFFCWFDLFWLISPQMDNGVLHLGILDLALHLSVFLGIGGIFVALLISRASHHAVRPVHDPRLADSLAFQNF